ncbi:type II toxin-antitoxin system VapB family antitoxin [Phreatobacter oligotrophus]|uniref:Putative transcription factor n=1 Tax=Phreatobacter oligotrophus TaxID=1122261 RepID=A0A2T4Z380_9HYPH|nr:type II toxin-antitoxin system VapB family antitoxin [Phreatobacter oligotrophus]PTM55234.1 putative transcription factor [Phreatobacter oligotrophus]
MAITVRNKALEERIKRIGRQRGIGPTAVITWAVETADNTPVAPLPPEEVEQRMKALDEITQRIRAKITDADRATMKSIEDDMYDEFGLPK